MGQDVISSMGWRLAGLMGVRSRLAVTAYRTPVAQSRGASVKESQTTTARRTVHHSGLDATLVVSRT